MIFVFGSNEAGRHGAGAALHAKKVHGAVYGEGIGPTGHAYGIPTKDGFIQTLPISVVAKYVADFLSYATERPDEIYQVTAVGCGLAGFTHEQIAPMFTDAPDNCWFDSLWAELLPGKNIWGTFDIQSGGYAYTPEWKAKTQ